MTYDWTDTAVKSVITDSKLFRAGGTFEFRVEPHGSGSRIHFSNGAPMNKICSAVYSKPTRATGRPVLAPA